MPMGMAQLLRTWLYDEPLRGHDGSQWPFPGQNVALGESYLFPGAGGEGTPLI